MLSNPKSTGNVAQLPRIREYCADHPDLFHYEVEHASQIGEAMKSIARVRPKVLAINGGDGTVQAALTELYNGGHFGDARRRSRCFRAARPISSRSTSARGATRSQPSRR